MQHFSVLILLFSFELRLFFYEHFESDDPEVYQFRVEQIRNSSVEELDLSLNFADEVIEEGRPASNPLVRNNDSSCIHHAWFIIINFQYTGRLFHCILEVVKIKSLMPIKWTT